MQTRILIIGDLHGQIPNIHFRNYDFIMCPGDFCSGDEFRKYAFEAIKWSKENPKKREKNWYDICGKEKAKEIVDSAVQSGRNVLEFLNKLKVPIYVLPGNTDFYGVKKGWSYTRKNFYKPNLAGLENVIDCDMRLIDAGQHLILGYGKCSGPEYPQHPEIIKEYTKKELKEAKQEHNRRKRKLEELFKKAQKKNKPIIFFSHNVPYNTKLDMITNKESPRYGFHFGSIIARELIEKHQPILAEAGHMHEHYDQDKIGKTICINSGFGKDANVLVILEGSKVLKVEFYRN